MTEGTIAAHRLASQRLIPPAPADPAELVRWLGAVQAQDFLGSLWALGTRLPGTTEASIEAAIAARTILRTWPMRGTVHFVPAEDARGMVELMAPKVISRTRSIYRNAGLDDADFARGRELVMRALAGGNVLRRGDLYARLEGAGFATGNNRGLHLLGHLAQSALICFGPRAGKQPTFVLLDDWVPSRRTPAREEAIAELVLRYFRSHGPATIRDFTWWTGLTQEETRAGLDAVKDQLTTATIDGTAYWWSEALTATPPATPIVHLLPPFDELLVSYKDRRASLDERHAGLWVERDHLASSTIAIDGRIVGTWKRTIAANAVTVTTTFARPLTDAETAALDTAIQSYGAFLGLPAVATPPTFLAPNP